MKHGQASRRGKFHAEYRAWVSMRHRCYSPSCRFYGNYGGRGIEVCQKWRESFEAFLDDMGPRPSRHHSLDRIDNDGNYGPDNCRWATWEEQEGNRRDRHVLEFGGDKLSVSEWARRLGLSAGLILDRLDYGWTIGEALTRRKHAPRIIEFNGESLTISQWAKRLGMQDVTLRVRLRVWRWSIEKALTTPVRRSQQKKEEACSVV